MRLRTNLISAAVVGSASGVFQGDILASITAIIAYGVAAIHWYTELIIGSAIVWMIGSIIHWVILRGIDRVIGSKPVAEADGTFHQTVAGTVEGVLHGAFIGAIGQTIGVPLYTGAGGVIGPLDLAFPGALLGGVVWGIGSAIAAVRSKPVPIIETGGPALPGTIRKMKWYRDRGMVSLLMGTAMGIPLTLAVGFHHIGLRDEVIVLLSTLLWAPVGVILGTERVLQLGGPKLPAIAGLALNSWIILFGCLISTLSI